ncbi:MAG: folate hydrolase, partial [Saprospiraceae bacterium]
MKRLVLFLVALPCILSAQTKSDNSPSDRILGFTDANAKAQFEIEKKFDALISATNQDTYMKYLSSHPHHVGSPQDKLNAEYMLNLFKSWGFQAQIEEFYVLFPTPKSRLVELLGTKPYKLKLEEPALPEDRTSGQKSEQLPTYNAYSADGDIKAELVYVNR